MERFVLGLVGEAGSGKGEVARILIQSGFRHYSLSDSLRRTASELGLRQDRESLIKIGNVLRERFGSDILARGAKQWVGTKRDIGVVIDSIRNPAEIQYLKSNLSALIIGINILPEKRFEFMKERRRDGDPKNWEEFLALLKQEQGVGEKSSGQQVQKCLELADMLLPNNGTKEELNRKLKGLLLGRGITI